MCALRWMLKATVRRQTFKAILKKLSFDSHSQLHGHSVGNTVTIFLSSYSNQIHLAEVAPVLGTESSICLGWFGVLGWLLESKHTLKMYWYLSKNRIFNVSLKLKVRIWCFGSVHLFTSQPTPDRSPSPWWGSQLSTSWRPTGRLTSKTLSRSSPKTPFRSRSACIWRCLKRERARGERDTYEMTHTYTWLHTCIHRDFGPENTSAFSVLVSFVSIVLRSFITSLCSLHYQCSPSAEQGI